MEKVVEDGRSHVVEHRVKIWHYKMRKEVKMGNPMGSNLKGLIWHYFIALTQDANG